MKEPGRVPEPDRIAGADILASKSGTCRKCQAALLVGQTRDADGTLRWHNFDAEPFIRAGLRVYLRHHCRF